MAREDCPVPRPFCASFTALICAAAACLLPLAPGARPAGAERLPLQVEYPGADRDDHAGRYRAGPDLDRPHQLSSAAKPRRSARQREAWQISKGRAATDVLPDDQAIELVSEGLKRRDSYGWSILRDDAVGFAVGIPAKLVKLVAAAQRGQWAVVSRRRRGRTFCRHVLRQPQLPDHQHALCKDEGRRGLSCPQRDGVRRSSSGRRGRDTFTKATCLATGLAAVVITVDTDRAGTDGVLFAAAASSLVVGRNFDPSARPRPVIEELPPAPIGESDGEVTRPQASGKAPASVDTAGTTTRLQARAPQWRRSSRRRGLR